MRTFEWYTVQSVSTEVTDSNFRCLSIDVTGCHGNGLWHFLIFSFILRLWYPDFCAKIRNCDGIKCLTYCEVRFLLTDSPYKNTRPAYLSTLYVHIWTRRALLLTKISQTSIRIWTWISKNIHVKQLDVINDPCHNFKCSLIKPPLKLGHG